MFYRMLLVLATATGWLVDYRGFKLEFDGNIHAARRWSYNLDRVGGTAKRPASYAFDLAMPPNAQQHSTQAYGHGYDRGHLVTSGHMNSDQSLRKRANLMTNIVPQATKFNQGIWHRAEQICESYRRHGVVVYGGVKYNESLNDIFLISHGKRQLNQGIPTPDYFWKVVIVADKHVLAWIFPNSNNVGPDLDKYLVSVRSIEEQLDDGLGLIPIPDVLKDFVPTRSLIRRIEGDVDEKIDMSEIIENRDEVPQILEETRAEALRRKTWVPKRSSDNPTEDTAIYIPIRTLKKQKLAFKPKVKKFTKFFKQHVSSSRLENRRQPNRRIKNQKINLDAELTFDRSLRIEEIDLNDVTPLMR